MLNFDRFERECNELPASARSTLVNRPGPQGRILQTRCGDHNCNLNRSRIYGTPRPPPYNESPNMSMGTPMAATDFHTRRRLEFHETPPEDGGQSTERSHDTSYNASGQPLSLSKFGEDQNRNQRRPFYTTYNASGQPLSLSQFAEDQNRNQRPPYETYNSSGQSSGLPQFVEDRSGSQGPSHGTYNSPGQPSRLPQFGEDQNRNQRDTVCASGSASNVGQQSQQQSRIQDRNMDVDQSQRRNLSTNLRSGTPCKTQPQNQLVQSIRNGNLNHLLPAHLRGAHKNPVYNALVIDNYFPGAIDDAVNGQIDFNQLAFDTVFECNRIPAKLDPEDVPMSLLEAFELRIQYESDLEENHEELREFCKNYAVSTRQLSEDEKDAEGGESLSKTHRDELKLATTMDVDLSCNNRDYPETELTQAITSLLRAEKINEFDENVHRAEEAVDSAARGEQEKAAVKSTCSFSINMQKDESVGASNSYKPIEIVSYIGTTQPAYN